MTDTPKQFTCEQCGGTFDCGWTDDEAKAEAEANGFGEIPDGDMAVICDDCYNTIMGTNPDVRGDL
jgi:hypothetical protein